MICPSCNKENYDGASFCVNCGFNLSNVARNVTPPPPPQNPYEYKVNRKSHWTLHPTAPLLLDSQINCLQDICYLEKVNRTAKKLAIISLCLYGGNIVLSVIGVILSGMLTYLADYNSYSGYSYGASGLVGLIFSGLGSLCYISAIVLAIIAKVKVSSRKLKNTFVNVVFWVEIGLLIAGVILAIILVVALAAACGAMIEYCY